nr:hypothetical protein [Tanacetum cinerariifolium]
HPNVVFCCVVNLGVLHAKNLEAQMHVELEEEERLARLKEEETNIALIESWDNTQAIMDADYEKKYSTKLKSKEKWRKPTTKAQKRNQMYTYLKNMANYKHNQLKSKSFKEVHMLFNNTMKWIEAFIHMDTGLVMGSEKEVEGSEKAKEGSSKRARSNLE